MYASVTGIIPSMDDWSKIFVYGLTFWRSK